MRQIRISKLDDTTVRTSGMEYSDSDSDSDTGINTCDIT